jgi:RNA polymerase sigma-70 factor (ECF subfamily)
MTISRQVFEDHVTCLLGRLHGVARRLTRNDADAEDLVAETLARAWRALDRLECEASFRSWMFRILHNAYISGVRRERARPQLQVLEQDPDDEEPAFSIFEQVHQPFVLWFSNPEQAFLDKLLREDLERAVAELPEHYRLVVILADIEEFTYGEIAQTLDIPIGTVRSRLARGRGALQKALWQQAQDYGLQRNVMHGQQDARPGVDALASDGLSEGKAK